MFGMTKVETCIITFLLNIYGVDVLKKITVITAFLVAMALQGCAQITVESIPVEKVVKIENVKKNELYVRANNWMVSVFNNAKSVVQFSDKESGVIMGRYQLGMISQGDEYGSARYAYATIKIKVKDSASKIIITPESFWFMEGNPYTLYTDKDTKKDIDNLITSFEEAMVVPDDNDW